MIIKMIEVSTILPTDFYRVELFVQYIGSMHFFKSKTLNRLYMSSLLWLKNHRLLVQLISWMEMLFNSNMPIFINHAGVMIFQIYLH